VDLGVLCADVRRTAWIGARVEPELVAALDDCAAMHDRSRSRELAAALRAWIQATAATQDGATRDDGPGHVGDRRVEGAERVAR
jgi:hypothetical protein